MLEEIVSGIGKTSELVSEIAAASSEQAQGIDQVNTAVSQMDKITQQNAASAEESASAAEELSSQAAEMQGLVGRFQISRVQQEIVPVAKAKPAPAVEAGPNGNAHHAEAAPAKDPEQLIPFDDKDEALLKEF